MPMPMWSPPRPPLCSIWSSASGGGGEVEDRVLEPLASGEAVLHPDEMEAGVILADIGGGATDIAIWKGGSGWVTSGLPVGGYQVSRDIAVGMGSPYEMAEQVKVKYANLTPGTDGKAKTEPAVVGTDNGQEVLLQDLNDIVRARPGPPRRARAGWGQGGGPGRGRLPPAGAGGGPPGCLWPGRHPLRPRLCHQRGPAQVGGQEGRDRPRPCHPPGSHGQDPPPLHVPGPADSY